MGQYFVIPGNVPGEHEMNKYVSRGVKPFTKPNQFARFDGRDSGRCRVQGVRPWNGEYAIGDTILRSIEDERALMLSAHYSGFVDYLVTVNQRNIAKNKAIAKVHKELTVANNLFESWYERKQSYDLLTNAAKELVYFVKDWKNPRYWKRFGKKIKQPSSLPEAWLTYQFGIVPLVGTIDTALNHLASPLLSAKVKGTSLFRASFADNSNSRATISYEYMERFTYGCTIQPNPNPNMALANIVGLSMPFSTAWQVVPWGWAIDYFVNVTELLGDLEVRHPGVFAHDWYLSTKFEGTLDARTELQYPHDDYFVARHADLNHFSRELIGSPTYATTYKFPLLGSNSVANLFSALALSMKKA